MTRTEIQAIRQSLRQHQSQLASQTSLLQNLFSEDSRRVPAMTLHCGALHVDFSKNLLDPPAFKLLLALAEHSGLDAQRQAMFDGAHVNNTEHRPALHVALRGHKPAMRSEIAEQVSVGLDRMQHFVQQVHSGEWRGDTGQPIRQIINIGIGGSDLGPSMATAALRAFHHHGIKCDFVSNVDPAHLQSHLRKADAGTTLFIVASKSFSTLETLQNARLACEWFKQQGGRDISRHFVAVSSNSQAAQDFGIAAENVFPMWDWVGGRFSLWSAIGLPIALATSMDVFRQLLAGAAHMDRHFLSAPLAGNIPVIMALLSVWYRNYWGCGSQAVLPYAQDLHLFPAFLQQLDMESLGKSTNRQGEPLAEHSGAVIWGSAGTNGQHSFHQLLHQGTDLIPADFIAIKKSPGEGQSLLQHQQLLANCLAQSRALMLGKSEQQAFEELQNSGHEEADARQLARHKRIPGNRPSTVLLLDELNPFNLGSLIALYEHKVFTQGVLWNLNPFDQWGVELGKQLSTPVFNALNDHSMPTDDLDPSTAALIQLCRQQDTHSE
ncbi:glucose-6-phosphate isomerase [Pseudohongiella spirulinae]|uniref:Glucose-6-phosphate isomerase n=1 Tax=Pseudohongiella spirulinae TaxID=1249552 RepID=A0A0S2KA96_9GAMM|nr:glucose-6-phosphate isomerase [Pseudohongiella spirulinae]ALO45208.1 glucose-6-phosphate isomerase [Pseudohongiella spirulinae]